MIEIEKYFNNFFKGTKNPSLHAMEFFMKKYNNFQVNMKFIHIAGTNGKGSCTEILTNILINQGYKVEKFLSPHLIKYNERISINNKNILDRELEELINELNPLIEEYNNKFNINITLFELETIMGLLYFYRKNSDFVILETGLGGLYDCTNIISKPLVSIITSIGLDHSHILGETLSEIAYQKAGIIKDNGNTVIFHQTKEIDNVFINTCKNKNNKIHIVNEMDLKNHKWNNEMQTFDYKYLKNLELNLKGIMQIRNSSLCLETIDILNKLGYGIYEQSIRNGLKTVIHHGRMEILSNNPKIIFDGAHNVPAIKSLDENIKIYYNNFKRIYIISILKRKNSKEMLELLSKDKNSIFILTSGNDYEKYSSNTKLYSEAIKYKNKDEILLMEIEDAINYAFNIKSDTICFCIGSFYTYKTVLKYCEKYNKKVQ